MAWHRQTRRIRSFVESALWWLTVAPYCIATPLGTLGSPVGRPLSLGGTDEQETATELLGRLWAFRSRLRLVRTFLILPRSLLLAALILLCARVVQVVTMRPVSAWIYLAMFLVVAWGLHLALHHRIPFFEVARLIDRRAGLQAQLATAVELTQRYRLEHPFFRTQIRLATHRLRELEPSQVVPFVWPSAEIKGLAVVGALLVAVSAIGSLGLSVPRPRGPIDTELARLASQEAQAPSQYVTVDPSAFTLQETGGALPAIAPQLQSLQQQLQSQAITPEQYRAQLEEIQRQIQDQASQSLAAQQALNALAAALKDSSTTHAVSDSLARGAYQQAAQQLADLGQQLSQLSPQARQELAANLARAASETARSDPGISRDAGQTADALQQGDTGRAGQGMQSLASDVQRASNQIAAQAELGQALQQIQSSLGSQQASQGNAPPGSSSATAAAPQGSSGAVPPSDMAQQAGSASTGADASALDQLDGTGQGDQNGTGSPSSSAGSPAATAQQIQGDQQSNAGGVGNGAGAPSLDSHPTPLDVSGVKLTITGQASGPGSGATIAGDRSTPLTSPDDSTITAAGGAAGGASNVPIAVHQESNVVPLEMKPVVREYFSNAGS
ncbi:MAG: hypothetical protein IRY83_02550 [Chloroflexi bacterium]|nr:hypothetical protein [Chloroflexota bacterium]